MKHTEAQTSVYFSFPDSIASWKVSWSEEGCFSSSIPASEYIYSISGDTILGTNTYKKINRSVSLCGLCCTPPFTPPLNGYMGAFREDTVQKKVYFFYTTDTIEKLIYDFNLVVGDTVVANFSGCCGFPTITSIDSILIGSNYRKKFNVDGGSYSYIEGIGGSWGFIEQLVTFESGSSLICFSENYQTLFPDTTSTCFIITSASKDLKGSETFKLYPNPTNQFTTLEFTNPTQQNCTLRLYDLRGQVVRTINNITTDQIGIERQSFASGLYFFQLRTDRQIIANGKLIIE